jgi:hypothetical protein
MATEEPVTQQPEKRERPVLMNPVTRNLIVGTAVVVILLTLTAWSGTIRKENALRDSLRSDVAALAAAFKYSVLEAGSMRTDAGRERLQPLVEEVTRAGGYLSVTLLDKEGNILASSVGSEDAVPKEELPKEPSVFRVEDGLRSASPILVGGSPIGYIVVETNR